MTLWKIWRKRLSRAPYAGLAAWYAGTKARVEARAALGQAEELRRVLEQLGKKL